MAPKKRKIQEEAQPNTAAAPSPSSSSSSSTQSLETASEVDNEKIADSERATQRRRIEKSLTATITTVPVFLQHVDRIFLLHDYKETNEEFAKLLENTPISILERAVIRKPRSVSSLAFQTLLVVYLLTGKPDFKSQEMIRFVEKTLFTSACFASNRDFRGRIDARFDWTGVYNHEIDEQDLLILEKFPSLLLCRSTIELLWSSKWKDFLLLLESRFDLIPFYSDVGRRREFAISEKTKSVADEDERKSYTRMLRESPYQAESIIDSIISSQTPSSWRENMLALQIVRLYLLRGYPTGQETWKWLVDMFRSEVCGLSYNLARLSLDTKELFRNIGGILPLVFSENKALVRLSEMDNGWARFAFLSCSGLLSPDDFKLEEEKTHFAYGESKFQKTYDEQIVKKSSDTHQLAKSCMVEFHVPGVLIGIIMDYFAPTEFVIRREMASQIELLNIIAWDDSGDSS